MRATAEHIWADALDRAAVQLGGAASPFDLAVEALLQGAAAMSLAAYSFIGEAGVLLARAGRLERALTIAAQDLRDTPAQWDAAPVYAAVIAHRMQERNERAAHDVLCSAERVAEAAHIYERTGPVPALYDLMDALAWEGLAVFFPLVAETASATGRSVIDAWRGDNPAPRGGPIGPPDIVGDADSVPATLAEQRDFERALAAAGAGENGYIVVANLVAVAAGASARGRAEIAERALIQALAAQSGSFGEEARRHLIYHEEFRFKAAHALGIAARAGLGGTRRDAFAESCLMQARAADDVFAGGGLLVVAGEAAMP
ncbi:MAG TPA: hypothetical protein VMV19_19725 [Xanthobacteraceae bacterium]|nr:hypothetical protein [Xanthobacteraceae bacterium]